MLIGQQGKDLSTSLSLSLEPTLKKSDSQELCSKFHMWVVAFKCVGTHIQIYKISKYKCNKIK